MSVEIERKYLVVGDSWRGLSHKREKIIDGLVAASEGRKARVRLYEDRATLAVKGAREGPARAEFEYEIPMADAAEMIGKLCGDKVVVKTRHSVDYMGLVWQIDEYDGALAGVIVAEVELTHEKEFVPLPDWAGREITDDPAYRKINLLNARLAQSRISGPPALQPPMRLGV
ncbi:CYTH domain-containing protein [Methylocystis sp. S23]|jgi:adenylate cyclase